VRGFGGSSHEPAFDRSEPWDESNRGSPSGREAGSTTRECQTRVASVTQGVASRGVSHVGGRGKEHRCPRSARGLWPGTCDHRCIEPVSQATILLAASLLDGCRFGPFGYQCGHGLAHLPLRCRVVVLPTVNRVHCGVGSPTVARETGHWAGT